MNVKTKKTSKLWIKIILLVKMALARLSEQIEPGNRASGRRNSKAVNRRPYIAPKAKRRGKRLG